MKPLKTLLLLLISTFAFVYLFYKQKLGLNLIVFEGLLLGFIFFIQKEKLSSLASKIVLAGVVFSGVFVIIHYSILAMFVNIIAFLIFSGTIVSSSVTSFPHYMANGISNFFNSIGGFFALLGRGSSGNRFFRILFNVIKIGIIPLLILFVFILMYKGSNPIFEKYVLIFNEWFIENISDFFTDISWSLFFLTLLGLVISIFTLIRVKNKWLDDHFQQMQETLIRRRKSHVFSIGTMALKQEYKTGVLLFLLLNALLLMVNIIDVSWVWINFEWSGEYLKQFVHQGTYLLIFSILISIGLVVFFFRGNLNYMKNNKLLKYLSYIWIAQNTILTLSVAMRNIHYINHFALAYKRIAVFVFLILTLYGLWLAYRKVNQKKTTYYVVNRTMFAAFGLLVVTTFFNWDKIIAQYNFKHYEKSFVHLDFLSSLSHKTLPVLEKDLLELQKIKDVQDLKFPFEYKYMSPEEYVQEIEKEKEKFKHKWEEKNLRSWNWAEHRTYKKLFKEE